jgi:hypothetical protein
MSCGACTNIQITSCQLVSITLCAALIHYKYFGIGRCSKGGGSNHFWERTAAVELCYCVVGNAHIHITLLVIHRCYNRSVLDFRACHMAPVCLAHIAGGIWCTCLDGPLGRRTGFAYSNHSHITTSARRVFFPLFSGFSLVSPSGCWLTQRVLLTFGVRLGGW